VPPCPDGCITIEERPVPQEPRQKTAKTQPYPIGDATVPQCAEPLEGFEKTGCIFEPFWEEPVRPSPRRRNSGRLRHIACKKRRQIIFKMTAEPLPLPPDLTHDDRLRPTADTWP
jgi:hypothetical protein